MAPLTFCSVTTDAFLLKCATLEFFSRGWLKGVIAQAFSLKTLFVKAL